eukprot:7302381-Prorocentrum_lima.AAC.1
MAGPASGIMGRVFLRSDRSAAAGPHNQRDSTPAPLCCHSPPLRMQPAAMHATHHLACLSTTVHLPPRHAACQMPYC